jgi:UDP-N-acetylglucosamine:LPS N-acetylglucosamine transferase
VDRVRRGSDHADVLLVCSSGGHLLQLVALRDAWQGFERAWVTLPTDDARSLLAGERVFHAHGPTTRNVPNLLRNLVLALRVVGSTRPRVVLTTGAAIAVPFAVAARLRGARFVYVESITRTERPSLTCRLVAPLADRVYAQWPDLVPHVRGARYAGGLL